MERKKMKKCLVYTCLQRIFRVTPAGCPKIGLWVSVPPLECSMQQSDLKKKSHSNVIQHILIVSGRAERVFFRGVLYQFLAKKITPILPDNGNTIFFYQVLSTGIFQQYMKIFMDIDHTRRYLVLLVEKSAIHK